MKSILKKGIGFAFAMIIAMQGMIYSQASEAVYQDGDIVLCDEADIYINEDFSAKTNPTTAINGTWAFSGANRYFDESLFKTTSKGLGTFKFAKVVTKSNDAGSTNKYVLSFDMTRMGAAAGDSHFLRPMYQGAGVKGLFSYLSDKNTTYGIKIASSEVVSGIPVGEFITLRVVYDFSGDNMTMDITALNSDGEMIGNKVSYVTTISTATGVEGFMFATYVTDESNKFDNIKLYKYLIAPIDKNIDSESLYTDGDFELCKESEIHINEDFSSNAAPKTANIGMWKFSSGGYTFDTGAYKANGKATGTLTFNTPLTKSDAVGTTNKYVLSFDVTRLGEGTGDSEFLRTRYNDDNKKDFIIKLSEDKKTYSLYMKYNSQKEIVSGIPVGEFTKLQVVYDLSGDYITMDVSAKNSSGELIGNQLKGCKLQDSEKILTTAGIQGLQFTNWATNDDKTLTESIIYDNIKFYNYIAITEPEELQIPGVPEKAADEGYIVNEIFGNVNYVNNNNTDAYGNRWSFLSTAAKKMETVAMTSGRKVMKISSAVSASVTIYPRFNSNGILYNDKTGAKNTYVFKFDMKYLPTKYNELVRLYYTDSNEVSQNIPLIDIIGSMENDVVIRMKGNKITTIGDKWYTVAVVFEMGATDSYATTYILDGNMTVKSTTLKLEGINNIKSLRFANNGGNTYLDNIRMYLAGEETVKGEEPLFSAVDVKLLTANGEADLGALPANTDVFVSSSFKSANENPVDYVPYGIFVAFKKLPDGTLDLVNATSVNLENAVSDVLQKMSYTSDAPLFTSDVAGSAYVVHSYIWKDMDSIYPCSDIQVFGE